MENPSLIHLTYTYLAILVSNLVFTVTIHIIYSNLKFLCHFLLKLCQAVGEIILRSTTMYIKANMVTILGKYAWICNFGLG